MGTKADDSTIAKRKTTIYWDPDVAEWYALEAIRRTKKEGRHISLTTLVSEALYEYLLRTERHRS